MNTSKIRTIAFAAYGKDFQAELDIAKNRALLKMFS